MSDSRRNRRPYKPKQQTELSTRRPIVLAKREPTPVKNEKTLSVISATSGSTSRSGCFEDPSAVQPKILLKAKEKSSESSVNLSSALPISIATRGEALSLNGPSMIEQQIQAASQNTGAGVYAQVDSQFVQATTENDQSRQPLQHVQVDAAQPNANISEQQPPMTKPANLITGFTMNASSLKLMHKTNTDFLVVGVIGAQGVGKSTILNILAESSSTDSPEDIYSHFFKEKDGIFPIKSKNGKKSSFPRTDSVQMFITKDRMILLDCPPVLCNCYRKDSTTNEIEDIRNIILLLTVCHLVIIVQDDYFNLSLMRLIQFAELSKPNQHQDSNQPFTAEYFPKVLFIKNKAKRKDFAKAEREKSEIMLKTIFHDSQLQIFIGKSDEKQKTKSKEKEKVVNFFVFPEVKGHECRPYHSRYDILVADLQNRVFMTPRDQICNGIVEMNESTWFDLISTSLLNKNHFFLTSYEEIRRRQSNQGTSGGYQQQNVESD